MESIRCAAEHCRAVLFKAAADAMIDGVQIKCRKCGTINTFRQRAQGSEPERRAAPSEAETARGKAAQDTPAEAEAPRPKRL